MPSPTAATTGSTAEQAPQSRVNGSTPAANGHPNGPAAPALDLSDEHRFPPPPKTLLAVLQEFMRIQDRRVSLWKEYGDAMEEHLRLKRAGVGVAGQGEEHSGNDEHVNANANGDSNDAATGHGHGQGHYASTPESLASDNLITRIVSLVTSGLLDTSHETRALSLELRHTPSYGPTRAELADQVDAVQEAENDVLRRIVRRDQARKVEVERGEEIARGVLRARRGLGRGVDDGEDAGEQEAGEGQSFAEQIAGLTREIARLRGEVIGEILRELRGEMADLLPEEEEGQAAAAA